MKLTNVDVNSHLFKNNLINNFLAGKMNLY